MKRALISVSDKAGIVDFATSLQNLGFELISTGGTYKLLREKGVKDLREISEFTGFPEGLGGRIKTLIPQIFGGILYQRGKADDEAFVAENNVQNIDLVVVNLYPFKAAYEDVKKSFAEKVEQIDIGGPSMIRAAAKNYKFCAPIVDSSDYATVLQQLESGDLDLEFREKLATKVFEMTACYDLLIAKFWAENTKKTEVDGALRYGENPHQKAVTLRDPFTNGANLISAEILNGKPLSYNNLNDTNAALELAMMFDEPFAAIIKHATPCGAAIGSDICDAFTKAYEADSLSAFGGIIALNRTVDKKTAERITGFFNEVIIAPDYDADALEVLRTKPNVRVLKIADFSATGDFGIRRIRGGLLLQDLDLVLPDFKNLSVATKTEPTETEKKDAEIAWKLVKIVKSNAIVVVKNGVMVGKGGGQTSRVEAMEIALGHAGEKAQGAVVASDAFFPFPDAVDLAGKSGISAIIQPGGSRGDDAVFVRTDELNIAMMLTEMRGFLH